MKIYKKYFVSKKEEGVVFVFVAMSLVFLVGLCALAIGLGYAILTQNRLQNIANLASLAALKTYTDTTGTESTRINAALTAAQTIIDENQINGAVQDAFDISLDTNSDGGLLYPGRWLRSSEDATKHGYSACSKYPCFQEQVQTDPSSNAFKLILRNTPDVPVIGFFTRIFGQDGFVFSVEATSTVIPNCTAFILDVSPSSVISSHYDGLKDSNGNVLYYNDTVTPDVAASPEPYYSIRRSSKAGRYAFPKNDIYSSSAFKSCQDVNNFAGSISSINTNFLYWCSMAKWFPIGSGSITRNSFASVYSSNTIPTKVLNGISPEILDSLGKNLNFQSDYKELTSPFGNVYVDSFQYTSGGSRHKTPAPLSFYFYGFNRGISEIRRLASGADKALFFGFTRHVAIDVDTGSTTKSVARRFPYPVADDPSLDDERMTSDLGFLVQLTNYDNLGNVTEGGGYSVSPTRPNFVDLGLFPIASDTGAFENDGTNLPGAINLAINELNRSCSSEMRKSIIVATDGISSCAENNLDLNDSYVQVPNKDFLDPVCDNTRETYETAADQLLDTILLKLQNSKIALTAVVAGNHIGTHYRNIAKPNRPATCNTDNTASGDCYYSFEELQSMGYGRSFDSSGNCKRADASDLNNLSLVDCRSYTVDNYGAEDWHPDMDDVYRRVGESDVYFRHPLGVMAQLSTRSGGVFCPLIYVGSADLPDYVDHDNDNGGSCSVTTCPTCTPCRTMNSARANHSVQYRPYEYLTYSQQAASCIAKTVAQDPYVLVAEE